MLDTNTISYFITGRSQAVRRTYFEVSGLSQIVISVLTEAELRFGLEKKPLAARLRHEFEAFFRTQPILPWTSEVAHTYARLRLATQTTGRNLSVMDLLIAAHALSAGATLVTHDQAFRQLLPLLPAEDWATDL